MSEFKYACPVCGQHIKCDSSQAGTQMECPTCFQKITVPQAPSDEHKFILTGSKVGERPLPKTPDTTSAQAQPSNRLSGAVVVAVILVCIAAAAAFVYRGTIFKQQPPPVPPSSPAVATTTAEQPSAGNKPRPPKPALIAPPASDTNWTLNLTGAAIPDTPAAGRVAGSDFICQRAYFSGGTLALHDGDMTLTINFSGAQAEALAGKTINVTTNTASAARVSLRWKQDDEPAHKNFTNDYAMVLHFGGMTGNRLFGNIYLCTPDEERSYVVGTFKAEIRKPRPKRQ